MVGFAVLMLVALGLLITLLTVVMVREGRRPPRRTAGYALGRGYPVDPGDLGFEFETWGLTVPSGDASTELPVWETASAETGRPVAVFVHGWGSGRIDQLARVGRDLEHWTGLFDRFVFYDRRGHGDSSDGGVAGLSRLGSDEHLDLHALLERLDAANVVLIGEAMGANVAIAAGATDATKRVVGVVAYGAYESFLGALSRRMQDVHYPTRPITTLTAAWYRFRGMKHRPTSAYARELACPLLMIHAGADHLAPTDDAQRIASAANDAQLEVVVGAEHGAADAPDALRVWLEALVAAD